jgi:hypothetical protein
VGFRKSNGEIMVEQASVLNAAGTTNQLVNKFIVSPIVNLGIAGFAFDIFEEHKVELQAEITDHFVEDNSTVQDHIAIKPDRVTLRGFVGELIDDTADPKSTAQELAEKLTIINSYIPVVTNAAKQLNSAVTAGKASTVDGVEQSVGAGVDLFQAYKELNPPDTRQAKAYNFIKALFQAKQLVSIDTPFGFMPDMAIENVVTLQADNKYITDFAVTLKKFRQVTTELVDFDIKKNQGRASNQKSDTKDQGTANGVQRNSSFAFDGLKAAGILN